MNFVYDGIDGGKEHEFRRAGDRIRAIRRLCELAGAPQAASLRSWLDDLAAAGDIPDQLLGRAMIERLLAALEGVNEAVVDAQLADREFHVRPEALERIQREAPELISYDDLGARGRVATLGAPMGDVHGLRGFLGRALRDGVSIIVD